MSGIERLLRRFDHIADRDRGYDHLDLDLRQQVGIDQNAAVVFGLALLRAVAHDMGDGHAGDTELSHRSLELFKPGFLTDNLDLRKSLFTVIKGRNALDLDSLSHGYIPRDNGDVLTVYGIILRGRRKARVCRRQTVLGDVETHDLFLSRCAQSDRLFDDDKGDDHHDRRVYGNRGEA